MLPSNLNRAPNGRWTAASVAASSRQYEGRWFPHSITASVTAAGIAHTSGPAR